MTKQERREARIVALRATVTAAKGEEDLGDGDGDQAAADVEALWQAFKTAVLARELLSQRLGRLYAVLDAEVNGDYSTEQRRKQRMASEVEAIGLPRQAAFDGAWLAKWGSELH